MNLLEKFDNLEIKNDNRIPEEDKEICIFYNNMYNDTLECYKDILSNLISLYNKYRLKVSNDYDMHIDTYGDFSVHTVIDSILKLKKDFISKVCYRFKQKYNVSIDNDKIYKKYQDIEVNYNERQNRDKTLKDELIKYNYLDYNIIIDEIFIQLGGCTFYEKATKEIKDKCIDEMKYKVRRMAIKGNKISIPDCVWYSVNWSGEYEISYNAKEEVIKLFNALSHFETGQTTMLNYYLQFADYNSKINFEKYELGYNKVEAIKFYKNRKIDIFFQTNNQALEFAKEYCGYIEKVA